ncbi:hypothetical protein POVWA1_011080 [Plasmodium ovale wallikeri]|uniref:Uncharacterized protein n=1 Tax=Plasmodium ovale wallikeri TaxID=864142 RepID=A0A1A8YL10_PLAOA|nr:hypothetical protein POVWA1_011080 [Plasmodium ovale wallikeri]
MAHPVFPYIPFLVILTPAYFRCYASPLCFRCYASAAMLPLLCFRCYVSAAMFPLLCFRCYVSAAMPSQLHLPLFFQEEANITLLRIYSDIELRDIFATPLLSVFPCHMPSKCASIFFFFFFSLDMSMIESLVKTTI